MNIQSFIQHYYASGCPQIFWNVINDEPQGIIFINALSQLPASMQYAKYVSRTIVSKLRRYIL